MAEREVEPSRQARITTIRVPQDLYDELVAVARADGEAMSVVIRRAIAHHIAQRLVDPDFRARAAAVIAREQALLAGLSIPEGGGVQSTPHTLTEYGTTDCPVEGVRAEVDEDGGCSACGGLVAGGDQS